MAASNTTNKTERLLTNPAGRLLLFVERVKSVNIGQPVASPTAEAVLSTVLQATGRPVLLTQLAKVLMLPMQIKTAFARVNEDVSTELMLQWLPQVEQAFALLSLSEHIDVFRNRIDPTSMYGMAICSDYLARKSPERVLNGEQVDALAAELAKIQERVISDDLPLPLKRFLLLHLDAIDAALREYRIAGTLPLEQALNAAVGAAMTNQDLARASHDTTTGKDVWKFLGRVHTILGMTWTATQIGSKAGETLAGLLDR